MLSNNCVRAKEKRALKLHFGLGADEKTENLEIRRSDETMETVSNIVSNQIFTITQNRDVTKVEEFLEAQNPAWRIRGI